MDRETPSHKICVMLAVDSCYRYNNVSERLQLGLYFRINILAIITLHDRWTVGN